MTKNNTIYLAKITKSRDYEADISVMAEYIVELRQSLATAERERDEARREREALERELQDVRETYDRTIDHLNSDVTYERQRAERAEREAMAAVVEAAFIEGQRSMRSDYEYAGVEASYEWEHSDAKAALRAYRARAKEGGMSAHPIIDDDHAAVLALKDEPYEPVETVEEVFRERDLKDAPIGYSSDEACAWCSGYDMAIARIRALGVFGTAPEQVRP